ncbi:hypothetical protein ILYODFUR_037590 [Ilyodon furcidens]|uniref:Uncharacterized protein n=1 Tax=Ilyodon furcidens TaxID=33524 RepID=A0ABV0T3M7_9TELE
MCLLNQTQTSNHTNWGLVIPARGSNTTAQNCTRLPDTPRPKNTSSTRNRTNYPLLFGIEKPCRNVLIPSSDICPAVFGTYSLNATLRTICLYPLFTLIESTSPS